ncbi:hypothetical protein EDB80DRAFT_737013, partial [Ilyonectria destructans]
MAMNQRALCRINPRPFLTLGFLLGESPTAVPAVVISLTVTGLDVGIIHKIQYKLRKYYHVAVNLSTISRRITSWSLPRQQARTKESPELIEATRDLIFR